MLRRSFAFIFFVLIGVGINNAQTPQPKTDSDRAVRSFSFSFDSDGGYLGVQTEEISKENIAKFGLWEVKGVGVESVVEGSPAQAAGLQKGDVIIKVNGDEITSTRKLTRLIGEISPDHQARITVLRGGSEREIPVTLGKRPGVKFGEGGFQMGVPMERFELPQMPDMPNIGRLPRVEIAPRPPGAPDAPMVWAFGNRRQIGVSLTPLTKQLAAHFGVDGGALVANVRENSPAAKAGLKAGDIIVEAEGKPVKGEGDLIRLLAEKKEGSVTLTIVRDRNRQNISVTPEEVKGGFDNYFEFATPDAPAALPQTPGVFRIARPIAPIAPLPLNRLVNLGRII